MSRNREDRRRDVYTYTTRTDVTHVLTCSFETMTTFTRVPDGCGRGGDLYVPTA